MFSMDNIKISRRLNIAFITLLVLTAMLSVVAIVSMVQLSNQTEKLYKHPFAVSTTILRIQYDISELRNNVKSLQGAQTEKQEQETVVDIDELKQRIVKDFEIIKERFLGDQEKVKTARKTFDEWQILLDKEIDLLLDHEREKQLELYAEESEQLFNDLENRIDGIVIFANNKADEFLKNAENTESETINLLNKMYKHPFTVSKAVLRISANIAKLHNVIEDIKYTGRIEGQKLNQAKGKTIENQIVDDFQLIMERFLGDKKDILATKKAFEEWQSILEKEMTVFLDYEREKALKTLDKALKRKYALLNNQINEFVTFANGKADGFFSNAVTVKSDTLQFMGWLIAIVMIIGLTFSFLITRSIINPLDKAVNFSRQLAKGKLSVRMKVENKKNETNQLLNAMNEMADKFESIISKNETEDWVKTGQAKLNTLMSGEQEISSLAKNVISFLTTYVDAQIGLFYLIEESDAKHEKAFLRIVASYAYVPDENMPAKFNIGEGLVGQVALERKIIFRVHEAQEFTHIIQSGLAQAVPRHVILLPFLYESSVRGVIEIGSSKSLDETQRNFLEQSMQNIGIAVNTTESRDKMQELLEKTQAQSKELRGKTDELQRQQGELQQTNEELQVQSEELQTQQEELRQSNDELENRTRDLEQQKIEVNKKNSELEKSKALIQAKAKEVELASKYKSEFLANMSHELRTPLNSLLILAQILSENRDGNLTEKQVGFTKTIHSAGTDLLNLINEILDLSKVEAGRIEINIEELSIGDLLEATEHKFKHIAEQKGIEFKISTADDFPGVLHTDSHRLQQVINNLLSNALKFTKQGSVTLSLSCPTEQIENLELKTDKILAVAVSDTGIGIPKDKQQVVFEAFQQADGTTSRKFGGTGLGLSISRQLSRLLGGDLVVQSEENKGSTFILYLPETPPKAKSTPVEKHKPAAPLPLPQMPKIEPSEQVNEGEKQSKMESTTTEEIIDDEEYDDDRKNLKSKDKSILVIEDDRKFIEILVSLIRERDFKVIVAEDGSTGLHLAERYKPSAIILDVGLPKLDGWGVMERLKNNPITRHIPVHFMSASDQSQDAKRMGAIGYLSKPVNMGQLDEAFVKIENFIAKQVKKVLLVSKGQQRKQQVLDLIEGKDVTIIAVDNQKDMRHQLQKTHFDCMIVDTSSEKKVCTTLLKQFIDEDTHRLSHMPIIIYADRELTHEEEVLLKQCENRITIKSVHSPERLLDETTLFLHQLETKLSKEKQKMLRLVHDKEAILENKKVLIVDDDIRNTFALMSFLEGKDMEVIVANHGKEALELLAEKENKDIVVILMDIMMPEMDGYETMRKIREQPKFRKLPIIALTAKAMKGDKGKCIEAGANDYVPKPVDTDKLLSLMRVWLYR